MTIVLTLTSARVDLDSLVTALDGSASVAIVAGDLLAPTRALAPITDDPFATTTALTTADPRGDLVVRHHRIVSVGTSFHRVDDPTHRSVGAVVIAQKDAAASRDVVCDLRAALDAKELTLRDDELFEALLVALVRGQIPVRSVEIVDVPWFRAPSDTKAAAASVDAISERRVNGLLANRVDDGFYSTFIVRKASKPLTRAALRFGMTPNVITGISFIIGLGAAAAFSMGSWPWLLAGALLLQVSLIVDCVDGELARATRNFTSLGAWLDASTDRVKEFAAYAGLAIGAARLGLDVWWIAVVLIVMQTTRHVCDYDFARIQRLREATVPRVDIREVGDGRDVPRSGLSVAMDASARMNRRSAVKWVKKVVHMPIGERWLLLSLLAITVGPAWALGGLLIAGLLALAYVLTGRVVRTLTWSGATPGDGSQVLRTQLDAGPVLAVFSRVIPGPSLAGRFGWSVPVLLRVIELGSISALLILPDPANLVIAFWIIFVIAYHHYDVLYRSLQGAAPPRWLTWLGFGWEGRIAIIAIIAATAIWQPSLTILLAWWVLWFAGVASLQWLRSSR